MKIGKLTIAIWVIAAVVLLASASIFAYSLIPKGDTSKVIINNKDFKWSELEEYETEEFEANDLAMKGIPMAKLLEDAGVDDPASKSYKVTGADGYEKTIEGGDMLKGYLVVSEKKTVFPTMTKSFWIRDVIEIQVE